MIFIRIYVAALLFCFVGPTASAQTLNLQLDKDEQAYADALRNLLEEWQRGKIVFQKNDASSDMFQIALKSFQERQQTDDLEKVIPLDFIEANWEAMPDSANPAIPLSKGAFYVMLGSILDAVPELLNQGIEPNAETMAAKLQFPFYLALASAQVEAQKAGLTQVDAVSMRRGSTRFLSLGWPFCCAHK